MLTQADADATKKSIGENVRIHTDQGTNVDIQ